MASTPASTSASAGGWPPTGTASAPWPTRPSTRLPHGELVCIAGGRHDALNDKTHRTVSASIVLFRERLRAGGAEIAHHEPPSREMIAR